MSTENGRIQASSLKRKIPCEYRKTVHMSTENGRIRASSLKRKIPCEYRKTVHMSTENGRIWVMAYVNTRWNKEKKAALETLIADNGWSEEDVTREREKAAFLDLTDKENVFFVYTR